MASTDLVFANEAGAREAINDLRQNKSGTNWLLFTYSEAAKNTLDLVGTGSGGIEELKTHLNESKMFYGLVRVTDKIDNSVTVKFVFIIWCGEKVPFVQKGKMTTHKGSISTLIGQYHVDINSSNINELSEDIIMSKVRDASGTAYHVKEGAAPSGGAGHQSHASHVSHSAPAAAAPAAAGSASPSASSFRGAGTGSTNLPKSGGSKQPGVPQGSTTLQFDEEPIRAAIKSVRADNDETDWMLMGYEGNTTKIILIGTGSGGIDELIPHLKEDAVMYGLYRTTDTVDNTVAIKFVHIIWVGEKLPIIRKARIATHKGEITGFIGQYHVDVNCSNLHEISEDIIRDAVQRASGTAVHVK